MCRAAGKAIKKLLEMNLRPSDIMTRAAFENAMVLIMATGGSTNAVMHLIAMARSLDVPLTIDDFQKVGLQHVQCVDQVTVTIVTERTAMRSCTSHRRLALFTCPWQSTTLTI